MDKVLAEKGEVREAMYRKGLGWVAFIWGDDTGGIMHIVEEPSPEAPKARGRGESFAREIPEIIARGRLGPFYVEGYDRVRRNIVWGGKTVALAPERKGQRVVWVLTAHPYGMKPVPEGRHNISQQEAEKIVSDATAERHMVHGGATQRRPLPSQDDLGAEIEQNISEDSGVDKQHLADMYGPEFAERAQEVGQRVVEIASQLAPQTRLELETAMLPRGALGRYVPSRNTIEVALLYGEPEQVVRHESIHALRELGLFDDSEWSTLETRAAKWRTVLTAEQRCPTRCGRAVRSRRRKNAPPMVPCLFWRGAGDVRRGALCGGSAGGCR